MNVPLNPHGRELGTRKSTIIISREFFSDFPTIERPVNAITDLAFHVQHDSSTTLGEYFRLCLIADKIHQTELQRAKPCLQITFLISIISLGYCSSNIDVSELVGKVLSRNPILSRLEWSTSQLHNAVLFRLQIPSFLHARTVVCPDYRRCMSIQ